MKRIIILFSFISLVQFSKAQNVGVGTASPSAKLHISGFQTSDSPLLLLTDSTYKGFGRMRFANADFPLKYMEFSGYKFHPSSKETYFNLSSDSVTIATFKGNGFMGIGSGDPVAALQVFDGNAIFSADPVTVSPSSFTLPIEGTGARMMWMPEKAAFRVGSLYNFLGNEQNYWNADSIGTWSFAAGKNSLAKGKAAVAMGSNAYAGNDYSIALGSNAIAEGFGSLAMGNANKASGGYSTAMGFFTKASGISSLSAGQETIASGDYSTALGYGSHASGFSSTVLGKDSEASGENATAMGYGTKSSGLVSTSLGYQTNASGDYSTAMGWGTKASYGFATSMGLLTNSSGSASTSMGTQTRASGNSSIAAGVSTVARAYASISLGRYNDSIASSSKTDWLNPDPLLILGNGTSEAARSNAMVVYKNGNTDHNGYTRLGESSNGAPRIKTKKITGYITPTSAFPNTYTFVAHGLTASKILSISVMVAAFGGYDFLPHSPDVGFMFTVNTDPNGGPGPSIAVGVKSVAQSGSVMGRPIKILITYEE